MIARHVPRRTRRRAFQSGPGPVPGVHRCAPVSRPRRRSLQERPLRNPKFYERVMQLTLGGIKKSAYSVGSRSERGSKTSMKATTRAIRFFAMVALAAIFVPALQAATFVVPPD